MYIQGIFVEFFLKQLSRKKEKYLCNSKRDFATHNLKAFLNTDNPGKLITL
jgi:hypothetical protein